MTFEQALAALEQAVSRLEAGELTLDEALECFADGVDGAARCRALLQTVETRVEQLLRQADGQVTVEPFATPGDDLD
ncbi:MAG: exodeoxyribonuclease VII small subunit [Desulfuromonadales bacterium]|nr:exodeoxyribonuclease VII small subunit [Desulfuromonadales bacterium]